MHCLLIVKVCCPNTILLNSLHITVLNAANICSGFDNLFGWTFFKITSIYNDYCLGCSNFLCVIFAFGCSNFLWWKTQLVYLLVKWRLIWEICSKTWSSIVFCCNIVAPYSYFLRKFWFWGFIFY